MAKNWAIAIGINQYNNLQSLNYAKFDAEAMRDWFQNEAQFDQVFLFTEDSEAIPARPPIPTQPTFGNLWRFLRVNFEEKLLEPGDNLWFFFAGHGQREAGKDYLMLSDSDPGDLEHTAIPIDYVAQRLRRSGADNVVLFLDACRDEGARNGLGINAKHPGVVTFYSCSPQEKAYEIEALRQGAFTSTLLTALQLQGEGNCATVERLYQYLLYQVPEINRRYNKPRQTPYITTDPATKLHLILLPKQANLTDVTQLKNDALEAEADGYLELAEQLWIRVSIVSPADPQIFKALKRIYQRQPEKITQPVTSSQGGRAAVSEPDPTLKPERPVFSFAVVTVNAQGQEIKREQRQAECFTEKLGNGIGLEMVLIPDGSFMMGSPEKELERRSSENPQHLVNIQSFCMGKYPVTQAQWKAVAALPQVNRELNPDPSRFKGYQRPVECVSWYDAVEFCARLTSHTKTQYSLPSEAEWEYACRAGTKTPFHFGETITSELVNYNADHVHSAGVKGTYRKETTEVGSFGVANAFGLYDMHGNVWEWCLDDWHGNYDGAPIDGSPWFNKNDNFYQKSGGAVLRGGSWFNNPGLCRSAFRSNYSRDYHNDLVGFRVVCVVGRILQ